MEDKKLFEYEVPQVVTYTDDEILEELGQAQAYGPGPMPVPGPRPRPRPVSPVW